jgi:hypothetical protein
MVAGLRIYKRFVKCLDYRDIKGVHKNVYIPQLKKSNIYCFHYRTKKVISKFSEMVNKLMTPSL